MSPHGFSKLCENFENYKLSYELYGTNKALYITLDNQICFGERKIGELKLLDKSEIAEGDKILAMYIEGEKAWP